MSKIVVKGWYNNPTHTVRCIRCNCVFEYDDSDTYEKMEVPPAGSTVNPYGYIRYLVDCPECGWNVPAIEPR